MLRLTDIKLPLDHGPDALKAAILKKLKLPVDQLIAWHVFKRAHDARSRSAILYIYTVDVTLKDESRAPRDARPTPDMAYHPVTTAPARFQRPLVIGAGLTAAALPVLGRILAVDLPPSVEWPALLTALLFGIHAAFAFSYIPLVRAEKLRPAMLFRTVGTSIQSLKTREYLDPWVLIPLLVAGLGIFGLAWWTTQDLSLVGYYAIGVIAAYLLLSLAGRALQAVLRAIPPLPSVTFRNAFRGIYRPNSPAPPMIL